MRAEQVPTGSRKLRPVNKYAYPSSRETGGPTGASLTLHSRRSLTTRRTISEKPKREATVNFATSLNRVVLR